MLMYYRRAMVTRVSGVPWGILSIFIFSVLPTISSVADLVPANKNDQSICKQFHRITATQQVSYIETYGSWDYGYHKVLSRINFKTQQITKWGSVEMCCPGYEPHELAPAAENCVPVCPSNCLNGTCNRPNECKCNLGYFESINNSTGFSECQPNCSSGCHGGSCIEPEICSCNTGYILAEDQRSCKASCIGVNGTGLQNCNENGICVAPDTCKCDVGYTPFSSETARGKRGAGSWVLTINSTFSHNSVTCKPLCEPKCSEHADCIAPDKCQCTNGYIVASISEPIKCLPVCEQNCINSFCSSPNICTCYEEYKPHDLLGKHFCEPICQDGCVNGKCIEPNYCECAVGYEKLVTISGGNQTISGNVCVPVCPGNCPNGRCVAPGQCHCDQGYVLKSLGNQTQPQKSCQPNCEPNCRRGLICIAPNQCRIKYNNDKILDEWPKFEIQIINNTDDCGIGHVFKKNHNTGCSYKFNDTECNEPNPCAIILVDEATLIKDLMPLQSIVFATDEKNISNYYDRIGEHDQKINWRTPKCTKECRILIESQYNDDIFDNHDILHCYIFELHNETIGFFSKSLPPLVGIENQYPAAICVLAIDERFDEITLKEPEIGVESNVHKVVIGIIGTTITLVLIVGLGVLLYRSRQKFSSIRHFRGVSASNDTMMERSEVGRLSIGEIS